MFATAHAQKCMMLAPGLQIESLGFTKQVSLCLRPMRAQAD